MSGTQCICFSPDEPPDLALKAEIEAVKAVRCPIHGYRFSELAPLIYVAAQFRQPTHLHPDRWKWHSATIQKGDGRELPAGSVAGAGVVDPDDGVRFVLKDGMEIHRIAPPALIYGLDTGKPCGLIDRSGEILPLSQPTVGVECRDATEADPA